MPLLPRRLTVLAGALLLVVLAIATSAGASVAAARMAAPAPRTVVTPADANFDPQCADPSAPATRDPANPLMLDHTPPHGDVLTGANFFVAGPARGLAAGAIAQLLGHDVGQPLGSGEPLSGYSDGETWTAFSRQVARELPGQSRSVQRRIRLLEKIAARPQPLRISSFSQGGTPAGVYTQTRKLFCTVLRADPHTIPVVTTYFLHPELGACSSTAQIDADAPTFKAQIDAMARAIATRPIVLFLELDATGSSACMASHGSIGAWEGLMRYEATTFEALPHTAVYLEGGYSDSNTVGYSARVLRAAGVRGIQGFFSNDTHLQWTSHELAYDRAISRQLGGVHFAINTAANGRGPLLNPHPVTEGVENLCNPPNRGLGIPDTTAPGLDPHLDALLWITPPGNSSGPCNGGTPSGTFWLARAISLAAHANRQLGPGTPSRPY